MLYIFTSPRKTIEHKLLKTPLTPSVTGYPEILQVLKYLTIKTRLRRSTEKRYGYKTKLQYRQPNLQQNNTRRTCKIIGFNPLFSLNVKINMAKIFLHLIDTHFHSPNKLHKIFNRNTISCTTAALKIYHKL